MTPTVPQRTRVASFIWGRLAACLLVGAAAVFAFNYILNYWRPIDEVLAMLAVFVIFVTAVILGIWIMSVSIGGSNARTNT